MSPLLKFWCTSCYTFSSIKWCKSISICILLNMGFYILLPMYLFILLCHLPCHWTYSECHSGQHWTVVLWCLMAVWYWFSIIYLTNNMEWDSWRIVKWKKLQDNKFSLMLRIPLQSRKPGFHPWGGKIPWRREWLLTPVFLPGESYGQRSLVGYSPGGRRVRHEWLTNTH